MREISIATLLDKYVEHLESLNLKEGTIVLRQRSVTEFILTSQIICPEDIVPDHIKRFEKMLGAKDLAAITRSYKMSGVRDFLTFLRNKGHILFNPSRYITLPRIPRSLPRDILTVEEVRDIFRLKLLQRNQHLRCVVEMLYGTGIRRTELLNLNIYDLDMKQRTLLIRQGKGQKDRLLPVPKTTARYMKEYIRQTRSKLKRTRALFLDSKDQRLNDNEIQSYMYRINRTARRQLGIRKKITCHVFRHSIATHLVQRGVDIRYVQVFLGHENLASTQIYTRIVRDHLAREIQRRHPREKMKIPFR